MVVALVLVARRNIMSLVFILFLFAPATGQQSTASTSTEETSFQSILKQTHLLKHSKLLDDDVKNMPNGIGRLVVLNKILSSEYIIQLQPNTTNVRRAVQKLLYNTSGQIQYLYTNVFKGAAITNMTNASITNLLNQNIVLRAARNLKVDVAQIVDQKNVTWNLDRISPPSNDGIYRYRYTGQGVHVFVVDTGIRLTHDEFRLPGSNSTIFRSRAYCGFTVFKPDCVDRYNHGTHVAATIGGTLYGVAKNVTLIAVKVFDDNGDGNYATLLAGIDYVVRRKQKRPKQPMVMNLSLNTVFNRLVNIAVNQASSLGIVVVSSAGNDANFACSKSPASAAGAITVGATTKDNERSWFSNYGSCVDILAPGSGILSASSVSNTATIIYDGTSTAAPHVSGIAALQLEKNYNLSSVGVWNAIRNNAQKDVIFFPPIIDTDDAIYNPPDQTPNLFIDTTYLLSWTNAQQ